ncbi:MAG: hypothetical protein AB1458_06935 [Bacteroidota bacterium]
MSVPASQNTKMQAPVFLLVLCLCTVAGSLLQLFISVSRHFNYGDELGWILFVSQGAYLLGALLMLRLMRLGFFIYVLNKIGFTIQYFFTADPEYFGIITWLRLALSIAFLVMYSLNYKHLK